MHSKPPTPTTTTTPYSGTYCLSNGLPLTSYHLCTQTQTYTHRGARKATCVYNDQDEALLYLTDDAPAVREALLRWICCL